MGSDHFVALLDRFTDAVTGRRCEAFAALFTEDGVYDDHFFGPHKGRASIAAMLDRFYVGGEQFCWQFLEPASSGGVGYARYYFSYLSREPESVGKLIVFEGMSRFRLSASLIAHYTECFDRGSAFAQLGYAAQRRLKLADRYARALVDGDAVREHLAWRARRLSAAQPPQGRSRGGA